MNTATRPYIERGGNQGRDLASLARENARLRQELSDAHGRLMDLVILLQGNKLRLELAEADRRERERAKASPRWRAIAQRLGWRA